MSVPGQAIGATPDHLINKAWGTPESPVHMTRWPSDVPGMPVPPWEPSESEREQMRQAEQEQQRRLLATASVQADMPCSALSGLEGLMEAQKDKISTLVHTINAVAVRLQYVCHAPAPVSVSVDSSPIINQQAAQLIRELAEHNQELDHALLLLQRLMERLEL